MYTGEHYFRRCLETDGYTRVVKVGTSATPTVTVPCAGCYQCREVKHAPVPTASGHTSQAEWYKRDFRFDVQDSGAANATVRVTLRTSRADTLRASPNIRTFFGKRRLVPFLSNFLR